VIKQGDEPQSIDGAAAEAGSTRLPILLESPALINPNP
jgi:hypothetical protein